VKIWLTHPLAGRNRTMVGAATGLAWKVIVPDGLARRHEHLPARERRRIGTGSVNVRRRQGYRKREPMLTVFRRLRLPKSAEIRDRGRSKVRVKTLLATNMLAVIVTMVCTDTGTGLEG